MARNHSVLRFVYLFIGSVLCIGIALFIWLLVKGFESNPPTVEWETPFETVGRTYTLKGIAADQESGLKRLWIALMQQGEEVILFDQTFPSQGLLKQGAVQEYPITLEIDTAALGLKDGEAMLRMACWDYSYKGWLSGNRFYSEHKVVVDTRPPAVEMVTHVHNLNHGGTGLAVYSVSEPVTSSGVQVADRFFPGMKGYFTDKNVFLVFFASVVADNSGWSAMNGLSSLLARFAVHDRRLRLLSVRSAPPGIASSSQAALGDESDLQLRRGSVALRLAQSGDLPLCFLILLAKP